MNTKFHELPVGANFHEPILWTTAKPAYMVYTKTTKSTAECVNQVNMSNTRQIGKTFRFAPNISVVVTD